MDGRRPSAGTRLGGVSVPFGSPAAYLGGAITEIAGCFALWAWLRLDRSVLWLAPGLAFLALFAFLLTRVDLDFAGRAYGGCGGVDIAASLVWLWAAAGQAPDHWDVVDAAICLLGAGIIRVMPHGRP